MDITSVISFFSGYSPAWPAHAIVCFVLFVSVLCLSGGIIFCVIQWVKLRYYTQLSESTDTSMILSEKVRKRLVLYVLLCFSEARSILFSSLYQVHFWWCSECRFTINVFNTESLEYTLFYKNIVFFSGRSAIFSFFRRLFLWIFLDYTIWHICFRMCLEEMFILTSNIRKI